MKNFIPTEPDQSESNNTTYFTDMKKIMPVKIKEREIEKRIANFILRNSEEFGHNEDKIKKNEEGYVIDILSNLGVSSKPVSMVRLS